MPIKRFLQKQVVSQTWLLGHGLPTLVLTQQHPVKQQWNVLHVLSHSIHQAHVAIEHLNVVNATKELNS